MFLTNDFDDPLTGFDTQRYIPCLRTDDLVFHLAKPEVRERLAKATGIEVERCRRRCRPAIGKLFEHFIKHRRAGLRDLAAAGFRADARSTRPTLLVRSSRRSGGSGQDA